jgi:nitrite reductase (NADH) small subunit
MAETFVRVAGVDEIPEGSARQVTVEGRWVGLFNVGGTFHAIDNLCLHRGGPLCEGPMAGAIVTCPWHGWQYDVTTGVNTMDESERVDRYEVKVEGDAVLVGV